MIRFTVIDTPWGDMLIASRNRLLIGTRLPGRWSRDAAAEAATCWPGTVRDDTILLDLQDELRAYARGEPVRFGCRVDLGGVSPFRRKVLEACRTIGYGQRVTYADLSRLAGRPSAARAAGGAMASNPIPLVIPCHRVLRGDGGLGGFSAEGGVDLKRRMLAWEETHVQKPQKSLACVPCAYSCQGREYILRG